MAQAVLAVKVYCSTASFVLDTAVQYLTDWNDPRPLHRLTHALAFFYWVVFLQFLLFHSRKYLRVVGLFRPRF